MRSTPGCACIRSCARESARAADRTPGRRRRARAVRDPAGPQGPLRDGRACRSPRPAGCWRATWPARTPTVWARLRRQGMVPLGHTHTHEFAAGGTTDQVGNPWALDRVVGGSSGGSAAALAARMTPAALGSDTCGSLRIPSACCGTSAIKPTHGLLSLDGIIPLAPTLDHPGPMARTIADCAALLAAMAAGGPPVDPTVPPPAAAGRAARWAHRAGRGRWQGVTIALTDRTDQTPLDAEVAAALGHGPAGLRAARRPRGDRAPRPGTRIGTTSAACCSPTCGPTTPSTPIGRERYRPAIAEFVEAAAALHRRRRLPRRPAAPGRRRRGVGAVVWRGRDRPRAGADAPDRPLRPRARL